MKRFKVTMKVEVGITAESKDAARDAIDKVKDAIESARCGWQEVSIDVKSATAPKELLF